MFILKRCTPLADVCLALQLAFWPTFWCVWASPSLLLRPRAISRIFMSRVWITYGAGVDENFAKIKTTLITQNARGVVLDLAAGYGYTAKYLDPTCVTKYVALEPNVLMHDEIRRAANAAGFTEVAGTLVLLACGAEDTATILTTLGSYQPIDTLVSVFALCPVPQPQKTIQSLVTDVLKPGGQMLFFEHVRNPLPYIAWWQAFWAPLWALGFDGCRIDRPTHQWIHQVGGWAKEEITGVEGEDEESLFWHRIGKLIKAT